MCETDLDFMERLAELRSQFARARVGLLLVGQAFRSGVGGERDQPCNEASFDLQHEASHSYIVNVIRPLERLGASIEVIFTFPECNVSGKTERLHTTMRGWFSAWTVHSRVVPATGIDASWAHGYDILAGSAAGAEQHGTSASSLARALRRYDYVLHGRHDLFLDQPLVAWPANFSRLSFEQECMVTSRGGCLCGTPWETYTGLARRAFIAKEGFSGVCVADRL